jgi:hypothetical protein
LPVRDAGGGGTIRANRRAVKILGATCGTGRRDRHVFREESRGSLGVGIDRSLRPQLAGGIAGLFDVALATNLDAVPGSIIRNYALEDKHPIHLDRARVAELGVMPVEASLFASDRGRRDALIHHDPARFAAAIRTIYEGLAGRPRRPRRPVAPRPATPAVCRGTSAGAGWRRSPPPLDRKTMKPAGLRAAVEDFLWENPICSRSTWRISAACRSCPTPRGSAAGMGQRAGYYDPDTRRIMLHEQALKKPRALKANFAVALGESLLGRYVARKGWDDERPGVGSRTYEIELRPPARRECFLNDAQLKTYLRLAQMMPRPDAPGGISDRCRTTRASCRAAFSSA